MGGGGILFWRDPAGNSRRYVASPRPPQAAGLSAWVAPVLVLLRDPDDQVVAPAYHTSAGSSGQWRCPLSAFPGPRSDLPATGMAPAIWSAATVRASSGPLRVPGAP